MLSQGVDQPFARLLDDFDRDALCASDDTIYGMWPDLTIAYFNEGWTRFAQRNGGEPAIMTAWTLGRCALDAIAKPLRPFFEAHYAQCLEERRPWEHSYECSSAKRYRKFHMLTYPLGQSEGFLVVNSLRLTAEHTRVPYPAVEALYRDEYGIMTQCCHCRRMRRQGKEEAWDWAPSWLTTHPAATSHGLCPACVGFHYSPLRDPQKGFLPSIQTAH